MIGIPITVRSFSNPASFVAWLILLVDVGMRGWVLPTLRRCLAPLQKSFGPDLRNEI